MPKIDSKLPTVRECLQDYSAYQLQTLYELVKKGKAPRDKSTLIETIASSLKEETLRQLWNDLDEMQKAAVAEAVYSDRYLWNPERFIAKYGDEPEWIEPDSDVMPGLSFYATPKKISLFLYEDESIEYLFIPSDLLPKLQQFVPPPIPLQLQTVDKLPEVFLRPVKQLSISSRDREIKPEEFPLQTAFREQSAVQDLQSVLRLIASGKISVSEKTRKPSSASLKEIESILVEGDYYDNTNLEPMQPFAWCALMQAAGLVEGKKLELTAAGQKAIAQPPHQTLRQIWKKWEKNKLFDELQRIKSIKGQTGKAQRTLTATDKRRGAIVQALRDCPVGQWVEFTQFSRYLQASERELKVTRDPDSFSLDGDPTAGRHEETTYEWLTFGERYLLVVLFEYMATLGMLDVAFVHPSKKQPIWNGMYMGENEYFSQYDGLLYFRLTALGAYCLEISDRYQPIALNIENSVKVLPNLEVVVTGNKLPATASLMLDFYAEKVSDLVWRIGDRKLLSAHADGHDLQQFQEFLLTLNGEPLPKTVEQLLSDIISRTQAVTKRGTAVIIDCADAATATLIANDSRTKKYCMIAGERSLVVPMESETKFLNALQKIGYSFEK